jgi:hypothetical protein
MDIIEQIIQSNQAAGTPGGTSVVRVGAQDRYAWEGVRKTYIRGQKQTLKDGTVVNKDYSLKELATLFAISYDSLKLKARKEGWPRMRAAYLSRVSPGGLGNDLNYYDEESSTAEASALAASNKLGAVLDKYINYRYGEILEVDDLDNLSPEVRAQIAEVNRNTGKPVFISELKEAIGVAKDIYNLHKQVVADAPEDAYMRSASGDDPSAMSPEQRQKALEEVKARLGSQLLNSGQD